MLPLLVLALVGVGGWRSLHLLQTKQAILHQVLGLGRLQGLQGGRVVCCLHQVLAGPQFRLRDRDRLGHSSPLHLEDRKGPGGYSYKVGTVQLNSK